MVIWLYRSKSLFFNHPNKCTSHIPPYETLQGLQKIWDQQFWYIHWLSEIKSLTSSKTSLFLQYGHRCLHSDIKDYQWMKCSISICTTLFPISDMNSDEEGDIFPEDEDLIAQIDKKCAELQDNSIGGNEEVDRHDDFRHLLTLLIMATAFNSEGIPLLRSKAWGNENDEPARQPSPIHFLHMVTTTFVRHYVIFAVTSSTTLKESGTKKDGSWKLSCA